jgi:hypothetical protein
MENWEWSQERSGDELTGYIHYALNIIHGGESIPLNETQVANSLNNNFMITIKELARLISIYRKVKVY